MPGAEVLLVNRGAARTVRLAGARVALRLDLTPGSTRRMRVAAPSTWALTAPSGPGQEPEHFTAELEDGDLWVLEWD